MVIKKNRGISAFDLVCCALILVMFSRVLSALGLPKAIDFAHFGILVLALFSVGLHFKRITTIACPIIGLLLVFILSGIWNEAGVVNVVLGFLLLAEPFLLVLAFSMCIWTKENILSMQVLIGVFVCTHISFSYFQFFALGLIHDDVKGIFIGMNNGHHVGGALSMVAIVYYASAPWIRSNFIKLLISISLMIQIVMSDAKQVVLVFLIAGFLYLVLFSKLMSVLHKVGIILLGVFFTLLLVLYVPGFSAWMDIDVIIEGATQKISVISIAISYFDSSVGWLLGVGPGHSISRLGWLIPEYYHVLEPIGVTYHDASEAIIFANQNHWMSNSITGSSLFSLFFSFAGVWGDLGGGGLTFYLASWGYVWKYYAGEGLGRLLLIAIFIFGWVFAYLEEPGFTMFICTVIILMFQEELLAKKELN